MYESYHYDDPYRVHSLDLEAHADPADGVVKWDPVRSIWNGSMMIAGLGLAPIFVTWDAIFLFFILTGVTLCVGHSVGFHRRLIHQSFKCPKWLDYLLAWVGTLVGMGGPLWMMRTHDIRDWAQRQSECHDYLAHRRNMAPDAWWNLHCKLVLRDPPPFSPDQEIGEDSFYQFLDRTWMLQQIPVAVLLFALGGWAWVIWGVCLRVTVCVTMHWCIGYLAHNQGHQSWTVDGASVQAYDVAIWGIPTMGESWHNNHHAFPGSAKLGLYPGQIDIGWWFIVALEFLGLAWDIQTPESLPTREGLTAARPGAYQLFRQSHTTQIINKELTLNTCDEVIARSQVQ